MVSAGPEKGESSESQRQLPQGSVPGLSCDRCPETGPIREEGSDPLRTEREALGVSLQHRLPDGSSKFLLALESLGMAIGTPARHDIGRQIGADTAQGRLRVRDGERNLAERWGREGVAVYQSLDPPSDGGVIVAIAGSARSFRGWDHPRWRQ